MLSLLIYPKPIAGVRLSMVPFLDLCEVLVLRPDLRGLQCPADSGDNGHFPVIVMLDPVLRTVDVG